MLNEPFIGGYDILNETNWGFENPEDQKGNWKKKEIFLSEIYLYA